MFKTIIVTAMLMLAGVTVAPTAAAGTYCNQLGNNPSIGTAQQVIMDAVMSDDGEGIATDIVENCPDQYGIIMEAGDQLLKQMGG